jgi:hypothetical protein
VRGPAGGVQVVRGPACGVQVVRGPAGGVQVMRGPAGGVQVMRGPACGVQVVRGPACGVQVVRSPAGCVSQNPTVSPTLVGGTGRGPGWGAVRLLAPRRCLHQVCTMPHIVATTKSGYFPTQP